TRPPTTTSTSTPSTTSTSSTTPTTTTTLRPTATPPPANLSPDCSTASASPDVLWPPNHRFVHVSVTGVRDTDGDPVTITIVGITQDEPLNDVGEGNTCPDATGVGTATAS